MDGMGTCLGFGVQIVSGIDSGIDRGIVYLQIMILLFSQQTQKENIWVSKPCQWDFKYKYLWVMWTLGMVGKIVIDIGIGDWR